MNLHKADVLNTHGDNSKLKKILKNFRFFTILSVYL